MSLQALQIASVDNVSTVVEIIDCRALYNPNKAYFRRYVHIRIKNTYKRWTTT